MNSNEVSEKLIQIYKDWDIKCARKLNNNKPYSKKALNYKYSAPFITHIPEKKDSHNKKIILVYGQEAHNWLTFQESNDFPALQNQAKLCYEKNIIAGGSSSPFWVMMRALNFDNYIPYWANLDKLHRVYESKKITQQLEYFENEEKILLTPIFDDNTKNIVQKEIEIINPSVVLFVTGPTYHKATKYALAFPESTNIKKPSIKENTIVNLSDFTNFNIPILWTYHPNFMMRHNLSNHLENLKHTLHSILNP